MRRVTLPQNVRYFQKDGYDLSRTNRGLSAGSIITIGEPEVLYYDHRQQLAIPFIFYDQTRYMLLSEMGLPELIN